MAAESNVSSINSPASAPFGHELENLKPLSGQVFGRRPVTGWSETKIPLNQDKVIRKALGTGEEIPVFWNKVRSIFGLGFVSSMSVTARVATIIVAGVLFAGLVAGLFLLGKSVSTSVIAPSSISPDPISEMLGRA